MQSDDLGLVERLRYGVRHMPKMAFEGSKEAADFRALGDSILANEGDVHLANLTMSQAAAAIERLVAERDEARRVRRWNIDEMGGTLHVCRGEHDGDDCEWESFVPADHLRAAEAQRDKLKMALRQIADLDEVESALDPEWTINRARQALKDAP